MAAKILVYPGDREEYFSFITLEVYTAIREWMDYRLSRGENITGQSLVMRDVWKEDDSEGISNPKPSSPFAITRLLNRAWQSQKIRSNYKMAKRDTNLKLHMALENILKHKQNRQNAFNKS
jgi:hypothetical protein